MRLVLISTIATGFAEPRGLRYADPVGYRRRWTEVSERLGSVLPLAGGSSGPAAALTVRYPRALPATVADEPTDTWSTEIADGSSLVAGVRFGELSYESLIVGVPARLVALPLDLVQRGVSVIEARISLCEHGVGVLRIDCRWPDADTVTASELERSTESVITGVGEPLVRRVLSAVGEKLLPVARQAGILEASEGTGGETGILWSSRILVVPKTDSEQRASLLQEWLGGVLASRAEIDDLLDSGSPNDSIVRWLKPVYAVAVGEDAERRNESVERRLQSLMYCHYLYSALEFHDDQLLSVLGAADSASSMREIRELRGTLEEAAERAQMVLFEHARASRYLERTVRVEMESIITDWGIDRYLVQPVVAKSDQVQKKLASLGEHRAERATLGTDVILLFIGVTSILGTLLAVADTGRTQATDPSMIDYNTADDSITGWLSGQATDAILIASMSASVMLIVLFVYLRSRSR